MLVLAGGLLAGCGSTPDLASLQDPETCAGCHPTHYAEWKGSMHAYASEDPLFRALNAQGQRETDGGLGDFCVRCHAPLAVELGLTEDGLDLDTIDPKLLGVTCYTCHSVDGVEGTHNNPLTLATDGVMRGGYADPVANAFHESAYSPYLDRDDPLSSQMCGSCHDVVTPEGLHAEKTYEEWRGSVYNREDQPFQNLQCGNCHLQGEDAPIALTGDDLPVRRRHAHTWPAVDLALTEWPARDEQRALVQAELDTVLNAQLCVRHDAATLDTDLTVDLENIAAGHSFPSGAVSNRRVWVEVVASREGEEVFVSGRVPEGTAVREVVDPTRWTFTDQLFDATGSATDKLWEAAALDANVLPPLTAFTETDPRWRDPHVIQTYRFEGPPPDRVTMAVHMRPFPLDLARSLVQSDDLDPAVVDAIPTFTLRSASLEWTPDLGRPCVNPI